MNLPRHSQSILAIDTQYFRLLDFGCGVVQYPFERVFDTVGPFLSLRQRAGLETDPQYRQVLPYKILTQVVDGQTKIVAYRRLRTGGESRLYGMMSIGFGGHIDLKDVLTFDGFNGDQAASTIDLEATIRKSARRELGEEVHRLVPELPGRAGGPASFGYYPELSQITPANVFIHYDLRQQLGSDWHVSKDVHCVHVAFVYTVQAEPGLQFVSGEPDQIELLQPMTAQELLASGMEMEEWTRLLLEHHVQTDAEFIGQ